MNKKAIFALAMLSVLLTSETANTSLAANYSNIGVKVGDEAVYSTMGFYPRFEALVNDLVGTFVNLTLTSSYLNGTTAQTRYFCGNVSAGEVSDVLIVAGLNAGDQISPMYTFVINRTDTIMVGGAMRSIDNLTWYADGAWKHEYWDQVTGMLVEVRSPGSANETLISTNMWTPSTPSAPSEGMLLLLVGGGAIAAIMVVAAVAFHRRVGK